MAGSNIAQLHGLDEYLTIMSLSSARMENNTTGVYVIKSNVNCSSMLSSLLVHAFNRKYEIVY